MIVIENKREYLTALLPLNPGEGIDVSFNTPDLAAKFRSSFYQTMYAIEYNPTYDDGTFASLAGDVLISYRRRRDPLTIKLSRRTQQEQAKFKLAAVRISLHPYLDTKDKWDLISRSAQFGIYIEATEKVTTEDLNNTQLVFSPILKIPFFIFHQQDQYLDPDDNSLNDVWTVENRI